MGLSEKLRFWLEREWRELAEEADDIPSSRLRQRILELEEMVRDYRWNLTEIEREARSLEEKVEEATRREKEWRAKGERLKDQGKKKLGSALILRAEAARAELETYLAERSRLERRAEWAKSDLESLERAKKELRTYRKTGKRPALNAAYPPESPAPATDRPTEEESDEPEEESEG